jgi:hypothetical protein
MLASKTSASADIGRVIDKAAADAQWHPAYKCRQLIKFIEAEVARDPELAERLTEHLDDAVADSWRGRTAFVRYPLR